MNSSNRNMCERESKFCNVLKALIRSLECPESDNFIQRFVQQLDSLLQLGGNCVHVHHISDLAKFISLLFERIGTEYVYEDCFCKLLQFCSQNFVFLKTSETINYADEIKEFFSMLGFLLGSTQDIPIIRMILNCTVSIISRSKDKPFLQEGVVLDCIANSQLPSIIGELLAISEFDIYVEYLLAIEQMFASKSICRAFLKFNTFDIILKRVCNKWRDYVNYPDEDLPNLPLPKHLNLSHRIMWMLTISYNESPKPFKESLGCIVQECTWRSVRNVVLSLISSNQDRYMRNVFFLLARTIAATVSHNYYANFSTELHFLTFTTEVPQKYTWVPNMALRPDKLDFEFKILLLSVLCMDREHPQSLDTYRKMNALEGIFALLDSNVKLIWSTYQRLELMKCALIGMENILPHISEDFALANGPSKLLHVLSSVLQSTAPISLLLPVLRCINTSLNCTEYPREKMAKHYRVKGIIGLFGDLLENISKSPYLTKMNQTCLAVSYCILEKVLKKSEDKLADTTKISVTFLNRFLNPEPKDSFLPPKVLIAIMSFLWENVVHYNNGFAEFLSLGGVYMIIDIIEKFPMAIKLLGLSILCELCEIQECLRCVFTWRGKTGQTIVPFLLKLYGEQCQFDKDHWDIKSPIQDIENPLMADKGRDIKLKYLDNGGLNVNALDFFGSCKPKIYAILCLLSCAKDKELIDSTYRISKQSLTNQEKIIAVLAENYLPLKLGQTWVEVNDHFEFCGIRPLVFDQEVIATKIEQYRNRTIFIQMQQFFYHMEDAKHDINIEAELYNKLREEVLCESLEALKELHYYAKCVDTMFRLKECLDINTETGRAVAERVDQSLLVDFHKTVPQYVNTTNVFNQKISVQSNVIIDPNKEEPPEAVSLDCLTQYSHNMKEFEELLRRNLGVSSRSYDITRPEQGRYYSVDYH